MFLQFTNLQCSLYLLPPLATSNATVPTTGNMVPPYAVKFDSVAEIFSSLVSITAFLYNATGTTLH